MPQEITATLNVAVAKGTIKGGQSATVKADQTTAGFIQNTQSIPTADTVITFTGITAPRWVLITNLDTVNFIKIGPTVAGAIAAMVRLKPGESCAFPMEPGTVLRGLADTAAVIIGKLLIET